MTLTVKRTILAALAFLIFGCQNIQKPLPPVTADAAKLIAERTVQISSRIPFRKVTVLWFTDGNGEGLSYGKMLADRIQSYLMKVNGIQIVDFPLTVNMRKWSSPDEVVRAGQLLNADVVLEGDLSQMQGYNDINARIFDVRNGKLIEQIRVRESIEDFRLEGGPEKE